MGSNKMKTQSMLTIDEEIKETKSKVPTNEWNQNNLKAKQNIRYDQLNFVKKPLNKVKLQDQKQQTFKPLLLNNYDLLRASKDLNNNQK